MTSTLPRPLLFLLVFTSLVPSYAAAQADALATPPSTTPPSESHSIEAPQPADAVGALPVPAPSDVAPGAVLPDPTTVVTSVPRLELQAVSLWSGARLSVGRVLSPRTVLVFGAGASGYRMPSLTYDNDSFYWDGSIGARVYIRPPAARQWTPTVEVDAVYGGERRRNLGNAYSTRTLAHSLGVRAVGGVTYFLNDHLGLVVQAGVLARFGVGGEIVTTSTDFESVDRSRQIFVSSLVELGLTMRL